MRALVVAAPSGYLTSLVPLPERAVISEAAGGPHKFVQFFATRRSARLWRDGAGRRRSARRQHPNSNLGPSPGSPEQL